MLGVHPMLRKLQQLLRSFFTLCGFTPRDVPRKCVYISTFLQNTPSRSWEFVLVSATTQCATKEATCWIDTRYIFSSVQQKVSGKNQFLSCHDFCQDVCQFLSKFSQHMQADCIKQEFKSASIAEAEEILFPLRLATLIMARCMTVAKTWCFLRDCILQIAVQYS